MFHSKVGAKMVAFGSNICDYSAYFARFYEPVQDTIAEILS